MYRPSAQDIVDAFGLGAPSALVHVQRGDCDAWRLETASGRYFVKGYFSSTGGQFHGDGLSDQLAVAMAFEQLALEAGVAMPVPVVPLDAVFGWLVRIEGRLFRAHRWVEDGVVDDVSEWLGRTMFQVHRLQPLGAGPLPVWWRGAVRPRATWESWVSRAYELGRAWAGPLERCLPELVAVTSRISALCDSVPDLVTTHGDFKPHNIVRSPTGPVLVDWDSVRTDSAALEAARVAYIFGEGDPERVGRILFAYGDAGGDVRWPGNDLFLSVLRNHLQVLAEQIQVSLGDSPPSRWMPDPVALEVAISNKAMEFPQCAARLNHLGAELSL